MKWYWSESFGHWINMDYFVLIGLSQFSRMEWDVEGLYENGSRRILETIQGKDPAIQKLKNIMKNSQSTQRNTNDSFPPNR